jgi:DNA-binding transcriptional LysR family regulator
LLDEGAIDLVLGIVADLPKRFLIRSLFSDKLVGVARIGHPALSEGLSLKTFVQLPHVRVSLAGDPSDAVDAFLLRKGLKRRCAMVLENFYALCVTVANSDLIAAIPERLASSLSAQHDIGVHPLPLAIPAYRMGIAWSRHGDSDPGVRWIRDRASEALAHWKEPQTDGGKAAAPAKDNCVLPIEAARRKSKADLARSRAMAD